MDADLLYSVISGGTLDEIVISGLRQAYKVAKGSTCYTQISQENSWIL